MFCTIVIINIKIWNIQFNISKIDYLADQSMRYQSAKYRPDCNMWTKSRDVTKISQSPVFDISRVKVLELKKASYKARDSFNGEGVVPQL